MKRLTVVFLIVVFMIASMWGYVYANDVESKKAKYIDSIEIDGNKVSSTTKSLIEVSDYEQDVTTSNFVVSGKGEEGIEISLYVKKNRKDSYSQDNLIDKFKIGKSGYFAKNIDLQSGYNYILIVATKDKDVQLNVIKVYYDKKEGLLSKIEKFISSLTK